MYKFSKTQYCALFWELMMLLTVLILWFATYKTTGSSGV